MDAIEKIAVSVKDLSFNYGETKILNHVNAIIPEGRITFILGKNGSGKSTFLKIIAGLLPYKSGIIKIQNTPLPSLSYSQRAKKIAYMSQHHHAVFPFSVFEVVLTGRAAFSVFNPSSSDIIAAKEAIKKTGIEHLSNKPYTELSGGEQQMVLFARTLAQSPSILLLDEPVSSLDIANQIHFYNLLKQLSVAEKMTIVIVAHDPNQAFLHGDHFLYFKDGSIMEKPNDIQAWDPSLLESIYGIPFKIMDYESSAIVVPMPNPF